jgi:hypothetical protein
VVSDAVKGFHFRPEVGDLVGQGVNLTLKGGDNLCVSDVMLEEDSIESRGYEVGVYPYSGYATPC